MTQNARLGSYVSASKAERHHALSAHDLGRTRGQLEPIPAARMVSIQRDLGVRNSLIITLTLVLAGCGGNNTRPDPIGQNETAFGKAEVAKPEVSKPEVQVAADKQSKPAFNVKQKASSTSDVTDDFSRSRLIAADFATTLSQIPETDPTVTVLHTATPSSRFGELLLSALQGAGFDMRLGDDSSSQWLSYGVEQDEQPTIDNNPVYTFIVAAGDVKLKRSYEVDEFGVRPTGNMFVRGANAADLVADDSIFHNARPEGSTVAKNETPNTDINSSSLADESRVTQRIELSAAPKQEPLQITQKVSPEISVAEAANPRHNLYETRKSKYQDLFESYEVIESSVLVFADDSLVLGKANKNSIASLVTQFNPQTDVMSVIGCSHGSSKIKNGNAYLANNRAVRVKNEFVTAGLNHDKVYEEGCWANEHYSKMPARGVLVQHRRIRG